MSNLNITKFHSKYYAYELTRAGGKDVDEIAAILFAIQKKTRINKNK